MFQIIDEDSKTYIDGGYDTERRARELNEELKQAGLKELLIITILPGEKPNYIYTKTSIHEIAVLVHERIQAKKMVTNERRN